MIGRMEIDRLRHEIDAEIAASRRQLRVDHGRNQFLDIALGFGPAFGEFVQADFVGLQTGLEQGLETTFALERELETMPGRRSHCSPPHVS